MQKKQEHSVFTKFITCREFIERTGAKLTNIPDAVLNSDVVIVAVSKEFYKVSLLI